MANKIIPKVVSGDVPRIVIPEGLSFKDAAAYMVAKANEQEEVAVFTREVDTFPWLGAYALQELLERSYSATVKPGGGEFVVKTGNGAIPVKWCSWSVAGLGEIRQSAPVSQRGPRYAAHVVCPRFMAQKAEALLEEIAKEVQARNLYAGTALILRTVDTDGDGETFTVDLSAPPEVATVPVTDPSALVLSESLDRAVRAELFLCITDAEALRDAGLPTRRGILLAGRPGTGKTLSARVAASLAIRQGWAVFYLPDARGLEAALHVAAANQPALLIAEDLDRQLAGERTALTDRILNALDGLDRTARLLFVGTTNAPEDLPAPLLRPGRLDSCLLFGPPDAGAAAHLVLRELGERAPDGVIPGSDAHTALGMACEGLLPASIREVAARSILHARLAGELGRVTVPAILDAADSVRAQQRQLELAEAPDAPTIAEYKVHLVAPEPEVEATHGRNGGSSRARRIGAASSMLGAE